MVSLACSCNFLVELVNALAKDVTRKTSEPNHADSVDCHINHFSACNIKNSTVISQNNIAKRVAQDLCIAS